MAAPLWQPSPERVAGSQQSAFAREVERAWGADGSSQAALHHFSIEQPGPFWESVWRFCQVIGERGEGEVLVDGEYREVEGVLVGTLRMVEAGSAYVKWGDLFGLLCLIGGVGLLVGSSWQKA